jgi:acetylornithine deacetylase
MALWTRVGGAATVVYGPGDVRAAHAPNERVSLAEMKAVADVLANTAGRLLRVGSAPHEA